MTLRCARSNCQRPGMIVPGKKIRLCLPHQISKPSKYKNVKAESALVGRSFDSRAERKRGEELALLEKAGAIRHLRYQVTVPLNVNDKRVCAWVADFVYEERDNSVRLGHGWREIHEDTKGFRTPIYELKRKLFHAIYGVEIRESGTERKNLRGKTPQRP